MSQQRRHIPKSPGAAMADDLCTTCRSARECVYCVPDREPVFSCRGYIGKVLSEQLISHGSVEAGDGGFWGLCVNCGRRFECARERPESGVWHCVDYC